MSKDNSRDRSSQLCPLWSALDRSRPQTMTGSSLNGPHQTSAEVKELAINLNAFKTRVDAINIDGVGRTKDDLLVPMVKQLFDAHNFEEVVVKAHTVRRQLEQLGAFKSIGVFIDTSSGDNSSVDGLEVTYTVVENRRVVGGVNTSIGNNNDGSLVLQLKCPNLLGRGLSTENHFPLISLLRQV